MIPVAHAGGLVEPNMLATTAWAIECDDATCTLAGLYPIFG